MNQSADHGTPSSASTPVSVSTNQRFSALPVGTGDAFLWQAENRTVLVDGGEHRQRALRLIRARSIASLEVVVCTHGDADHTDGLVAVLREPSISIGEVWVPARWGNRLAELVRDPFQVLRALEVECHNSKLRFLEEESEAETQAPNMAGENEREQIDVADVEQAVSRSPEITAILARAVSVGWAMVSPKAHLWIDALFTASRIWKVVRAALISGARLRWFEHGRSASGGHSWLSPVNSAEVLSVPRTVPILRWLNLSRMNKEALVFLGSSDGQAVLFCSDSELSHPLDVVPRQPLLITAPHHGSDTNAAAYAAIAKHTPGPHLWVRSDDSCKTRPCNAFTQLAVEQRACTTCHRCSRQPTSVVEAGVVNGRWALRSPNCIK